MKAAVVEYADPLAKDEKLRRRLAAAIVAAAAASQQMSRQTGATGQLRRLATDRVLRAQLAEVATQLQAAQKRVEKTRSHKLRNTLLFVGGVGMILAAVPSARGKLTALVRERRTTGGWPEPPREAAVEEEIEVGVPVSTAYNQWTQFEEFPRFMDGVDEVTQLDDTLLHWAATVAGKRAEWDAKIVEQEPDRRIAWEATGGKQTRGAVSFEEAGPGRSRIRLHMSYRPEGAGERLGSAIGLDKRRIRGDLERFRELIEAQHIESGAWRGEIHDGIETSADATA